VASIKLQPNRCKTIVSKRASIRLERVVMEYRKNFSDIGQLSSVHSLDFKWREHKDLFNSYLAEYDRAAGFAGVGRPPQHSWPIDVMRSNITSSNYSQVLQRECNPSDPDPGGIGHPPLLISRLCESMP
jgi:hypothetical protein